MTRIILPGMKPAFLASGFHDGEKMWGTDGRKKRVGGRGDAQGWEREKFCSRFGRCVVE